MCVEAMDTEVQQRIGRASAVQGIESSKGEPRCVATYRLLF